MDDSSGGAYIDDAYTAIDDDEPTKLPPRDLSVVHEEEHYYDGAIRFHKLGKSLHRISRTMGSMVSNRNVLFAASSMQSAANLIPMACEMAKVDRNFAHFALFGRSTIPLTDILMLNGVSETGCGVFFHDARGDYAEYSTDARLRLAIQSASRHIHNYMHPQIIFLDGSEDEDPFFKAAIQETFRALNTPLVGVPRGRYAEWLWITRVDAAGLTKWFDANIEILIHAPHGSSGGLVRLLRSLNDADYKGLKVPRLTIELPTEIEYFLHKFLTNFKWPPGRDAMQTDSLILRHRIPDSRITSVQSAIRFVESFYPSNKDNSHVLVLSPRVEVSPLYLQYLHFNILQYRTQLFGWSAAEDMFGISLDNPDFLADGKTSFEHPVVANTSYSLLTNEHHANEEDPSPYLHERISSTAALIFGEKWAIFHDFLPNRVQASHSGKNNKTEKSVTESEPTWVEFATELMRARGWSTLHPASSFVTVHDDLAQIPEEYAPSLTTNSDEVQTSSDVNNEEPFVLSPDLPAVLENVEADADHTRMPLHQLLPFNGDLLSFSELPYISHNGTNVGIFERDARVQDYATWFRAAIGGCASDQAGRSRVKIDMKTDDLFCLPGVDIRFEDEDDEVVYDWATGQFDDVTEAPEAETKQEPS